MRPVGVTKKGKKGQKLSCVKLAICPDHPRRHRPMKVCMRGRVRFMKIGPGVSELWGVENRPLPLTRPMAYTTACTTVQAVIFDVFVLLRRITLWPWPLTLRVCHVQCFSCLTHIPIFIILWLSVTELRVLNIWSHFCYLKQSLRMRGITWPVHRRSPKTTRNKLFFDPELPIHYTTFMRLRWRLRVVYIWASPC